MLRWQAGIAIASQLRRGVVLALAARGTTASFKRKRDDMSAPIVPGAARPSGTVARVTPESAILFVCDIQER